MEMNIFMGLIGLWAGFRGQDTGTAFAAAYDEVIDASLRDGRQ
jgi:hypothetical protein